MTMFRKFQLYLNIIALNRLCVSTTKPSMLHSTEGSLALAIYTDCECLNGLVRTPLLQIGTLLRQYKERKRPFQFKGKFICYDVKTVRRKI